MKTIKKVKVTAQQLVSLDSELDLLLNPVSSDRFITDIRLDNKTESSTISGSVPKKVGHFVYVQQLAILLKRRRVQFKGCYYKLTLH